MKKELFRIIGFTTYIVLSCVDRFVAGIPDIIYIPVMIVALALIIVGIRKQNATDPK